MYLTNATPKLKITVFGVSDIPYEKLLCMQHDMSHREFVFSMRDITNF